MSPENIRTRGDILAWISSSLKPCKHTGSLWVQMEGFRRAFYIHGLYKNSETGEYAFHVEPDDVAYPNNFPNMGRYNTREELLESVSEIYRKLWNIPLT